MLTIHFQMHDKRILVYWSRILFTTLLTCYTWNHFNNSTWKSNCRGCILCNNLLTVKHLIQFHILTIKHQANWTILHFFLFSFLSNLWFIEIWNIRFERFWTNSTFISSIIYLDIWLYKLWFTLHTKIL